MIRKSYSLKGKIPTNAATVKIVQKFFRHHEDVVLAKSSAIQGVSKDSIMRRALICSN